MDRNSYLLPDGRKVPEYYIVSRQDSAVCVCRVGDSFLLVRQYRPGIRKVTVCHPGGRLEGSDVSPTKGALRELFEETGLRARNVRRLGSFAQIPAVETGRVHLFVVECEPDSVAEPCFDATEAISTLVVKADGLGTLISSGKMDCLACVAASRLALAEVRP